MRLLPRISLRYKILFLLCFLATTVLSIFLFFSTSLFQKDKTVYIFDSAATYSRSISNQINSISSFTIEKINIILGGLKNAGTGFDVSSKKLFNEDSKIKNLLIVTDKNGDLTTLTELSKPENSGDINLGIIDSVVSQVRIHNVAFLPHEKEDHYLLGYVFSTNNDENIYVVVSFEAPDLKRVFNSSQSFASYLIDQSGEMVLKGDNVNSDRVIGLVNSRFFNSISKNKLPEGTAEVETQDGVELLVSYNRVGFGDLIVISEIDKVVAFETLKILLIKSALFFIALLSMSVIISVIFSNTLTSALLKLSNAVRTVSDGNFDVVVSIKSSDEVGQLADGFNIMTDKISRLLTELKQYSDNLEMMVEERTRELREANNFIQTMINSLGQGLLVFKNDGMCQPVYTHACVDIFKEEPKGKAVWDLLKVTSDKLAGFKKWVDSIFKQMIPFKDMVKLGPQNISDENRFISLDYQPMVNPESADDDLMGVVMVATDRTEEHFAKLEAQKKQDHVEMITKIVRNKEQFLSFIKEAYSLIDKLMNIVEEGMAGHFDPKATKLLLHSLKGSSGVYSLSKLQKTVHEYETELDEYLDKDPSELTTYLPKLKGQIEGLTTIFKGYNKDFIAFLGESAIDGQYRVELKHDNLVTFSKKLKTLGEGNPIYQEFVNDFIKVPIIKFFKGYNDLLLDLAKRRGKEVNPIVFNGGDLKINKDGYNGLFNTLVHIFTNAVDHGFETGDEREAAGKERAGTLIVSFSKENFQGRNALKIVLQDNGKGIDPERIRKKLIQNGVSESSIEADDYDVIQHIFDESFSTADTVSLTSGRGVGMSAVKSSCEALGGGASISSVFGQGTRVLIVVPYA